MTAVQPPLFLPGWERESCGDADPVVPLGERRRSGEQLRRREVGTREPHTLGRRVRTVHVKGDLL